MVMQINQRNPRNYTCALLDMVEQGIVDKESLIRDLLGYMSEADVADFAHCNDYIQDDEEDEEVKESGMLESKCQRKQDMTEGAMSEIHMELSQVVQDEDYSKLSDLMSDSGPVGQYLQQQIDEITYKTGLHPDDDFEEIETQLMARLQSNFGDDDVMAEGGIVIMAITVPIYK